MFYNSFRRRQRQLQSKQTGRSASTYSGHTPSTSIQLPNFIPTVKLDSQDTTPPLHYSPTTSDRERQSSFDSTPVSTPKAAVFGAFPRKTEKERDLLFSWHHRGADNVVSNDSSYIESALLDSDLEDCNFPLFGQSPPRPGMAARSSPINITNKPYSSLTSPRQQQTSNLTNALHSTTGNGRRPSNAANAMTSNVRYMGNGNGTGRHDSMGTSSGLAPYSGGAQPISMNRTQQRRESIAGSLANGMSWGGVSVGSWIRDE